MHSNKNTHNKCVLVQNLFLKFFYSEPKKFDFSRMNKAIIWNQETQKQLLFRVEN